MSDTIRFWGCMLAPDGLLDGLGEQGLLLLDDGALLDEQSGEQFATVTAAREHYAMAD